MSNIAFFGLGTMGLPMAINLMKAGHIVHILHRNSSRSMARELEAQKHGAIIHDTLHAMIDEAEFVISIVPNDEAVYDIYMNENMRESLRPGTVIIEMTSCSPEAVIAVQDFYQNRSITVIDAPVTGALPKAIEGTLTIMGAGDPSDFSRAAPIFDAIAEKVFQLGKVGNGKLIKSMTNLLGAINLAAVGEFFRFAKAMGLDMEQLAELVPASAGGSIQFSRNFERITKEQYSPAAFSLSLLRKDMGIALSCASSKNICMPLAECAYELYKSASAYDADDCSAIAMVSKKIRGNTL